MEDCDQISVVSLSRFQFRKQLLNQDNRNLATIFHSSFYDHIQINKQSWMRGECRSKDREVLFVSEPVVHTMNLAFACLACHAGVKLML